MSHRYLIREIILKYHRGEPLTDEEQAMLDAEMAHLPADKVWERIRSHVEGKGSGLAILPWYIRWPAVTAAAAAVVALIAVGLYRYGPHSDRAGEVLAMQPVWRTVIPGHYYAEIPGPNGAIAIDSAGGGRSVPYPVLLPDGSTVTLSYQSSIRYVKTFAQRKIVLSGQAYFKIAQDEAAPFAVETGKETVNVLGTEFNLMHYPGIPDEVTLLSGKIGLSVGNLQKVLEPADRAVIEEGSPIRVRVEKMRTPEKTLAWLDPQPSLQFDSTDLYTVIQRVAQFYQVDFLIDPDLVTGSRVTATLFLQQSLEQNMVRMADILNGYAQIKITKGMIEVRKSTL